ncbi:MAG: ATP-binding protein [Alphaproteobacteria bacterium]|nr:ATP-binding protein [Alphaproteobacteria bacterium]
MLVVILPLVIVPVLVLGLVGFVTASRQAEDEGARFLRQRENDLRLLADNTAIRDYFYNDRYGLVEEASLYRDEIRSLLTRFVERGNARQDVYLGASYVGASGMEIVAIGPEGDTAPPANLSSEAFWSSLAELGGSDYYASDLSEQMSYVLPIFEPLGATDRLFLGAIKLDFTYPRGEFEATRQVIASTFVITTIAGLTVAGFLIILVVGRLTAPIRGLSTAADRIASGDRSILVESGSADEIGNLAQSFNRMAASLGEQEEALRRRGDENAALYEIAKEITAQVSLEPTLELIAKRARELLNGELSLIALLTEDGEHFAVRAGSGDMRADLKSLRFSRGEGVGGRVAQQGKAVIVNDYARELPDSPFLPVIEESGWHSVIAAPLGAHGQVAGVLYVFSSTPERFSEDDLRLLSAVAVQAAVSIENAMLFAQVRGHAQELERTVEERTRDLRETNRRLEEASEHKSRFLANMSHELRTPMNAIIGFTRLVMRKGKEVLPERQYENLGKILVSAEHLLGLINDILDLSKIEAGHVELHPGRVVLDELLKACIRTVEPMVDAERVRISAHVPQDLPELSTDQDKLRQIVINLLSNAAKFTEEGSISVAAEQVEDRVSISFHDTGIGIPEDKLSIIFDEFQQVDDSTTRRYGGTGLGLSICRRLAELLGGSLSVRSKLGDGSTFTLTLPIHCEAHSDIPVAASARNPEMGVRTRSSRMKQGG